MADLTQWGGLREDLAITADEGVAAGSNVSYRVLGELRRRPGLGPNPYLLSGILATDFQDPVSTYVLFNNNGTLQSIDTSALTIATLKSGLNAVWHGCFAKSNGRAYFTDDFDPVQRINYGAQAAQSAGYTAPPSAPSAPTTAAGNLPAGTYAVRYRYFDSQAGYFSNATLPVLVTITGSSTLQFSIGATSGSSNFVQSSDAKVDQITVEMTDGGSGTYYQVATVNQTVSGVNLSLTVAQIDASTPASTFDGNNLGTGWLAPPVCALTTYHRGRQFFWGAVPRTITGVTFTSGATAVSTTGAVFSTAWLNRLVLASGDAQSYRIAAITGATSLTLSTPYSGSSGVKTIQLYSSAPDLLGWSRAGYPEACDPVNWARRVLQNSGDLPSGLISYYGILWLFGQRTIQYLDYQSDPAQGQLTVVPTEMGLWNQQCLVQANGYVFGWGRSGVWMLRGIIPQYLSRAVDFALQNGNGTALITAYDATKSAQFHGVYDPHERAITWFYVPLGSTTVTAYVKYDIDRDRWSTGSFPQSIQCSTLVAGGTNDVRALLCDANGYSWYLTDGVFDGVPKTLVNSGSTYTGILTVSTSGATTTVIPVNQALPTPNQLAGVTLSTTSGATAVVASNTASTITLASPLAAAPAIGTELWLGAILSTVRSKWNLGRSLSTKKRRTWNLRFVPDVSQGQYTVKTWRDFSTSADVYTAPEVADLWPSGVTVQNGVPTVTVAMDCGGKADGHVSMSHTSEWRRSAAIQVQSQRPIGNVRLLSVTFDDERPASEVVVKKD